HRHPAPRCFPSTTLFRSRSAPTTAMDGDRGGARVAEQRGQRGGGGGPSARASADRRLRLVPEAPRCHSLGYLHGPSLPARPRAGVAAAAASPPSGPPRYGPAVPPPLHDPLARGAAPEARRDAAFRGRGHGRGGLG